MQRRKRILLGVLILLLLATVGWLGFSSSPPARWERRVLARKFQGGAMTQVGWFDVFRLACSYHIGQMESLPAPFNRLEAVRVRQRGQEPCSVLWDTTMGPFWGRPDDLQLLWALVNEQLVDQVYHREPVVVRPGDVVVDVGSHLGTFTRFALNRGARLVLAFEPNPTNIACFKRTFQREMRDGRVLLVEAALWETSGTLSFSPPVAGNSGTGSVRAAGDNPGLMIVPATTLDETVQRLKLERLDFLKMDIQGAERLALLGARQSLARFGPRIVLDIDHRPDDPTVLPQVVREARPGYHVQLATKQAYFY